MRVFWLRPSDVPFDQRYPGGIGKVMIEAQKYYQQELGKELAELGNSEIWRAGKATRSLRPHEAARAISADTKGVGGRGEN